MTESCGQDFVAAHYGARATEPRLLGAGDWSQAFSFTLDGRHAVIWFGRHVEDFLKDRIMAAYSSAALPIPAVKEIGRTADGYFAVSERAAGQRRNDLDGAGMCAALPGLLRALDELRALDPPGGGYGGWAADGIAAYASWPEALLTVGQETARVPGWQAAMAASPVGTSPFREAYARLQELVTGLPPSRHIIHGDLANRNVRVQGPRSRPSSTGVTLFTGTTCTTPPGSATGGPGSPPGRPSISARSCTGTGHNKAAFPSTPNTACSRTWCTSAWMP